MAGHPLKIRDCELILCNLLDIERLIVGYERHEECESLQALISWWLWLKLEAKTKAHKSENAKSIS